MLFLAEQGASRLMISEQRCALFINFRIKFNLILTGAPSIHTISQSGRGLSMLPRPHASVHPRLHVRGFAPFGARFWWIGHRSLPNPRSATRHTLWKTGWIWTKLIRKHVTIYGWTPSIYTAWVKKIPPRFSDIFSQTVGNFWSKFYTPIIRSHLR